MRAEGLAQGLVQTSNCTVGCGLYVLRYVESGDGAQAPMAWVRPAAGYERSISVLTAPGLAAAQLDRPGAALVVISQSPGLLEISVEAPLGSRAPSAQFALELLSNGVAQAPAAIRAVPGAERDVPGQPGAGQGTYHGETDTRSGLDILAHVSRFGDVSIAPGAWIAGPEAPLPIEGLSIRSTTEHLSIAAQFTNSLRPDRWSAWQTADFVGTRQQASPLMGLKLRLDGPRAADYELMVEALFLGSPIATAKGQEVVLISNSGLDPLVGLKLELRDVGKVEAALTDPRPSRVRVFRTSERSI